MGLLDSQPNYLSGLLGFTKTPTKQNQLAALLSKVPAGPDVERYKSLIGGAINGLTGFGPDRPSVTVDPSGSYDSGEGMGLLGNALPLAKSLAAPLGAMTLVSSLAKAKGVTTDVSALARALRGEAGAIAPTDRLAGLLGDNAGMTENAKFRISDVFGNGSRLDHYDDAKGLMYSQQKLPNGNSKWTVFETYPDSEGGNQVLGQMLQHGSLDDAIKSVRGARISQTLKTNNAAKYGGIPNTWDGEAKKVAKKLIDSGVDIDRFGQSTQSTSKYIYLANGRKIRMANHDLPSNYDAADFDHRYGGDIQSLINGIKQSP